MSFPLSFFVLSRLSSGDIISKCVDFVKKIDSYESLKGHPEIILMICNIIEYSMDSNKYKIDKKELAISALDKLFPLSEEERNQLRVLIQFMYDTNQIKGSIYQQIIGYFRGLFCKKK
jgi:hypothetical protein